jgi:hypothetical protein
MWTEASLAFSRALRCVPGVRISVGLERVGMSLASRKFVWILVSGVALAAVLFAVGDYVPQVILYLKIRRMLPYADSKGKLSTTPKPLTETAASTATGTALTYFGCRFEVPWQAVAQGRNEGRWAEVKFSSGQTIRIFNPNELYVHEDLITARAVGDSNIWELALEKGFPKSKYEQFKAVISATPKQLSPFQSRAQFARTFVLISQKGVYFEHTPFRPELLTFEKPDFRGFEASGLSQGVEDVTLTIFSSADRMFILKIQGDQNSTLNQSEINRVIGSFSIENTQLAGMANQH